jgi:hypothetical protein
MKSLMHTPLAQATGALRELLIALAVSFEDDSRRPCCDDQTTLDEWAWSGILEEVR